MGNRHFWLAASAVILSLASRAEACTLSAPDNTDSREIELTVDCPGAPFFKISERSDFGETAASGVVVTIDAVGPDQAYADISVSYPGGVAGGNGLPFEVPGPERELRLLVVLFHFADGGPLPGYATPAWAEKLVFTGGHDGRGFSNSIKAHIEQNTYGAVTVTGEVYPQWLSVRDVEAYRRLDLDTAPDRLFAQEIVENLRAADPGFFIGKDFDFLVALTPGALLATTGRSDHMFPGWPDPEGVFEGWAMYDIPVDSSSPLYATITDERRASESETIVVPRFNPLTVDGVWLASDAGRSGTNYFEGGRVRTDPMRPNRYAAFIELGTPLPAAGTEVVVSYTPRVADRADDARMVDASPDTLPDAWGFGHVMHELYHAVGHLLTPAGDPVGDLYHNPQQLIGPYGLMARGAWNISDADGVDRYVPANLSSYSKVKLGLVSPYELRYGENETGLRLWKSAEGDFRDTETRTKIVKVPLHPAADNGHRQLVELYPMAEARFSGQEYLLLEWRTRRADIEAGGYNFDEGLPHEGLVVYRVIEGDPGSPHGDMTGDLVRIVDASAAYSALPRSTLDEFWAEDVFSLETSPAPYGTDSGLGEYVAGAAWNWKAGDRSAIAHTLSAGAGEKIIRARFMNLDGAVVAESSATLSLDERARNAVPVADAGPAVVVTDDDRDGVESVVLDGSASSDADGIIISYDWHMAGALLATGVTSTVSLPVGEHTVSLIVADEDGATASDTIVVRVLAGNVPPVAVAGADVNMVDADGDGIETVTLDGSGSYDDDGTLVGYSWYREGTLIGSSDRVSATFASGSHTVTLVVTDDAGATSEDALVVDVTDGTVRAPSGLTVTETGGSITLAWSDNSTNEIGFVVEQGSKKKGEIVFSRAAAVAADVTSLGMAQPAETVLYRVMAIGTASNSDYSNLVEYKSRGNGDGGGNGNSRKGPN